VEQIEAGARIGHYQVARKLGAGGMGEVYRAQDLKLERPVAIKLLPSWAANDPVAVERLVREAKLASSLNHPHIVTIYAIEEFDSLPFLVMEYVEGETLRDRLGREPLEVAELAAIGAEVADALESAHRIGLIHRDVKSSNILITSEGHAKVVDFGLAKMLPSDRPDPDGTAVQSLTATGAMVGTAAYMSPEQTRGEPLDSRTDLFSLGVVLYEAATGRLPFEGPSVLSVLHEIALVEPPAPSRARPGLPRALDQVLLRAMAKDKARRYATAAELAAALRGLTREGDGREDGAPQTRLSPASRRRCRTTFPPLTSFVDGATRWKRSRVFNGAPRHADGRGRVRQVASLRSGCAERAGELSGRRLDRRAGADFGSEPGVSARGRRGRRAGRAGPRDSRHAQGVAPPPLDPHPSR
jgi:serine/threonine protein kinase